MDDMTAFERQVAAEVAAEMPPERPVHVAAVFDAAVTARSSQTRVWRFQSMLSATRFVVAGAIVALFGGLLLAGLLARPSVELVPGAATESPGPTTTESLLSGMTTEEVEPGVFRVIDDGLRQLVADAEFVGCCGGNAGGADIVAGLDGSVWWFESDRFFRLGDELTHAVPWPQPEYHVAPWDLEVAPDGTLWSFWGWGKPEPVSALTSFDGRSWTAHDDALPDGLVLDESGSLEVRSDGTVWATTLSGRAVVRMTDGSWERVTGSLLRINEGPWEWAMHLAVAEATDDEISTVDDDRIGRPIYRLDDSAWREHSAPALVRHGESGPNGQLWVQFDREDPEGRLLAGNLALFDGDEWRTFETGPDAGSAGPYEYGADVFEVAPDGSVWFRPGDFTFEGCDGIANFDGESAGRHLRDLCIYTFDVAPDGHVWVVAGPTPELMHAYVITPEAVMGARS